MTNINARIIADINSLVDKGHKLVIDFVKEDAGEFWVQYQGWYSDALLIVKQILPERYEEFTSLYEDKSPFNIARYLHGFYSEVQKEDIRKAVGRRFAQQNYILQSSISRINGILSNIRGAAQAELFDNELEAAEELRKARHVRAAGMIAGVVLEGHLSEVCTSKGINLTKKNPTINDWSMALKDSNFIDLPTWRKIQYLADVRNICAHATGREPTSDEVDELIRGTDAIIKTVF